MRKYDVIHRTGSTEEDEPWPHVEKIWRNFDM